MEFMEGGQVDDREFMKRHCIATHEVVTHAHTHRQHNHTHEHISVFYPTNSEREEGRGWGL